MGACNGYGFEVTNMDTKCITIKRCRMRGTDKHGKIIVKPLIINKCDAGFCIEMNTCYGNKYMPTRIVGITKDELKIICLTGQEDAIIVQDDAGRYIVRFFPDADIGTKFLITFKRQGYVTWSKVITISKSKIK